MAQLACALQSYVSVRTCDGSIVYIVKMESELMSCWDVPGCSWPRKG